MHEVDIKILSLKKRFAMTLPNSRHSVQIRVFNGGYADFCHNWKMQTLHSSKLIAKLVLVWFALFLGSAIASTVIKPGSMQMVCTAGGGMKMIDMTGDDGELKASASMDCPLCASVTAPPPPLSVHFEKLSPLAHALQPIAAAHIASVSAPPLPSRGPPTSPL